MPTIPRGLRPVVESFSVGAPLGVDRIEVAGGMPRYGLDFDRGQQEFRVQLPLDAVQLSAWTAFYHHVIAEGVTAFDLPLDTGFGVEDTSVQIVPGTYGTSRRGVATVVSFTVKAVSSVYDLSEAGAIALIEEYNGYAAGATPALPRALGPVTEGYGYGGTAAPVGSEIAGGLDRFARTHERGCQQFRVTLVLEASKYRVWVAFLHHVLKKGAVSFEMPLDSGFGEQAHLANIVPGSYSAVRNGVITVVSFAVEAESSAYAWSAVQVDSLLTLYDEYGSAVSALLQRIELFANQDTLDVVDLP